MMMARKLESIVGAGELIGGQRDGGEGEDREQPGAGGDDSGVTGCSNDRGDRFLPGEMREAESQYQP